MENFIETYLLAADIAHEAHDGQVDSNGEKYLDHVYAVSFMCNSDEAKIVGLLHDVLEDCYEITSSGLIKRGIPKEIVYAVLCLSHGDESYDTYIQGIKTNKIACEVKIADLKHNMDISRIKRSLTEHEIKRTLKYHKYYVELLEYWNDNYAKNNAKTEQL